MAGRRAARLAWICLGAVLVAAAVATAFWAGQHKAPAAPAAPGGGAAPLALAAPAAVAAPVASRPAIPAAFARVVQAQQPDFKVEAHADQPRLRIGRDRLGFKVTSARDGHVYVLVGGPDGSLLLLYPNSVAEGNRIRAGQTLHLPQANWALDTSEPAGTEHFVVIVSAEPRDFSHFGRERDAWFLKLPDTALAAEGAPGTGPALAGQPRCSTPGCGAYGAAQFSVDVVN